MSRYILYPIILCFALVSCQSKLKVHPVTSIADLCDKTQKVVFDAKNQGIFNKSVFILSNAENKRVSLNIKGHVKSEENK